MAAWALLGAQNSTRPQPLDVFALAHRLYRLRSSTVPYLLNRASSSSYGTAGGTRAKKRKRPACDCSWGSGSRQAWSVLEAAGKALPSLWSPSSRVSLPAWPSKQEIFVRKGGQLQPAVGGTFRANGQRCAQGGAQCLATTRCSHYEGVQQTCEPSVPQR